MLLVDGPSNLATSSTHRRSGRRVWPLLIGVWWFASTAIPAAAQWESVDQRFVSGLRERRLYDLAESFCRQRLAAESIAPREQAELILQLAQTEVAEASELPLEQQGPAWELARQTLSDFLRDHPEHPQREILVVQHALTLLARGQILRQEWELDPERSDLKSLAAETLRQGVAELESAERLISDRLPLRQRQRQPDQLSLLQLMALQNNTQYQLAESYLNRALLYGDNEKSARVDALTQVEERLDQLKRRIQPEDPLSWRVLALRMECRRRLGIFADAEALWPTSQEDSLPADSKADLWNERFQLALAQNRTSAAVSWLPQIASFYTTSPKLCLSLVQLFLTMAAQSDRAEDRDEWQRRADQTMRVVETYHGTYWARRARALLLASGSVARSSSNRDLILRLADELLRKRQPDEAVRLLDLAGSQAGSENRSSDALQFAIRAAQVQQQRGLSQDAADRFRIAAIAHPDQPESAAAHLAAGWNLAQLIPRQPDLLDEYIKLLREHLATWPDQTTAGQAAIWLATVLQRQNQWSEALQVAASVDPAGPVFAKAVAVAAASAISELDRAATAEPDTVSQRASAIDETLANWLARAHGGPATDNGSALAELRLTRIIVRLAHLNGDPVQAEDELNSLIAGNPDQAAGWLESARAWQSLCRAVSGESVPPTDFGDLPLEQTSTWLAVAERHGDERNRVAIGALIVGVSGRIGDRWSAVDSPTSIRWRISVAESLWDQGEREQALEQFAALRRQFPRVLEIQVRYAQMATRDTSGQSTDLAIDLWRAVGAGCKPRSDGWFRAKYELARLLAQQDRLEEAEKILRYLKTVPPGWEQSTLKREFESLLADIDQRQSSAHRR